MHSVRCRAFLLWRTHGRTDTICQDNEHLYRLGLVGKKISILNLVYINISVLSYILPCKKRFKIIWKLIYKYSNMFWLNINMAFFFSYSSHTTFSSRLPRGNIFLKAFCEATRYKILGKMKFSNKILNYISLLVLLLATWSIYIKWYSQYNTILQPSILYYSIYSIKHILCTIFA